MQEAVLDGYQWKGKEGLWNLKRNQKVTNAIPILKKHKIYIRQENTIKEEFVIIFKYASGKEGIEITISDKELTTGKFVDKIPADVAIYLGYSKKIIEIYRLLIQEQISTLLIEKIEVHDLGWNEKRYYWLDEEKRNDSIVNGYDNAMKLAKLISASNCISSVVLAAIHGVLLRLLNEAGITHNYVTYLEGETGIGKTDMAKKICNYQEKRNIFLSLNSDKRMIKRQIQDAKDITVVIDDHCISGSTRVRERQLDTMSEIIQNASDSGKILISGTDTEDESAMVHLLVTGEKRIKNFSTFNRCFLITMDEQLSDEVWSDLNEFSKAGKMYEFMKLFVLWIQENYDEIVLRMRTNYQEYVSRTKVVIQHKVPGVERIRSTVAVQLTLSKCLLDYFYFMKIEEKVLRCAINTLSRCIWDNGTEMCMYMLEQKKEKNMMKYLPTLAEIIIDVGNCSWLANSEKVYYKYLYQNGRDGKCIGVCVNKGYWSFEPKRMSELIADELGIDSVSVKGIGAELRYYSLVRVDGDGKASCRWHSEKRMYHVRIKELIELIYPESGIADETMRRITESY